jgi:hypothetical protein
MALSTIIFPTCFCIISAFRTNIVTLCTIDRVRSQLGNRIRAIIEDDVGEVAYGTVVDTGVIIRAKNMTSIAHLGLLFLSCLIKGTTQGKSGSALLA